MVITVPEGVIKFYSRFLHDSANVASALSSSRNIEPLHVFELRMLAQGIDLMLTPDELARYSGKSREVLESLKRAAGSYANATIEFSSYPTDAHDAFANALTETNDHFS